MPSSAELHNVNAHALLAAFFGTTTLNHVLDKELKSIKLKGEHTYNPREDYGSLYVQLIKILREEYIKATDDKKIKIGNLIYRLYHNDNKILPRTYEKVMQEHLHAQTPTNPSAEEAYRHLVSEKPTVKYAAMSPLEAGGNVERFRSTLSSEFDPMSRGLPTIRRYRHSQDHVTEYRFPTQARRVKGKAQVDPLFEAFISSQPEKKYVYFNFLRRDERKFSGFKRLAEAMVNECRKENQMTQALEALEKKHENLTVITLPADDALMDKKAYLRTDLEFKKEEVKTMFKNVILERAETRVPYKDFHISENVRKSLFPNGERDVDQLIEASFQAVGVDADRISEAQRQAVWFDLVNYRIPQLTITRLEPAGFNLSCKDAIDRGGVASAWLNLMQSFARNNPMTHEDFEQAIHAAPVSTKGRGMNEHVNRLWNMVNEYVNANQAALLNDPSKNWLVLWRDMHCPKQRAADVLEARIKSARARLDAYPEMKAAVEPLLNAITDKKGMIDEKWNGTLLEVVGRTMSLVEHKINHKLHTPEAQKEQEVYDKLIHKVESNAKLGFLTKFMLGIRRLLTPTVESRTQVVNAFKKQMEFFKPAATEPATQATTRPASPSPK